MLEKVMQECVELTGQGMDPPTIAAKLGVSVFWVKMVTGTDGFKVLMERWHEGHRESPQGGQGESGEGA